MKITSPTDSSRIGRRFARKSTNDVRMAAEYSRGGSRPISTSSGVSSMSGTNGRYDETTPTATRSSGGDTERRFATQLVATTTPRTTTTGSAISTGAVCQADEPGAAPRVWAMSGHSLHREQRHYPCRGGGRRVGLSGVLERLDRTGSPTDVPGRPDALGLTWDAEDRATSDWMPQGITTSFDAHGEPRADGPATVLVSWYARDAAGRDAACRISVLERSEGVRYAHVRLVRTHRPWWRGRPHLRQVPVHAGGVLWWGSTLLVASTRAGLLTFDLDDIALGDDGAFVLPQSGACMAREERGQRPLRYSFLSLDRCDEDRPWLVVGEYRRSGTGARIARFALDPRTGLPVDGPAQELLTPGTASMQGATRVDGTYYVSASHGATRPGHLYVGDGTSGFSKLAGALPIGPEDLSYDRGTDRLWTVTEYPDKRWVLAVPRPSVR